MKTPRVAIILGSASDIPLVEKSYPLFDEFGIAHDVIVASAHRTPKKVMAFVEGAEKKYDAIIAGAGMAAHLPGVVAAHTILPVIGLPISSPGLDGFDALFSVVQMPPGVPVASVAINGSKNAAILAAQILALKYPSLRTKLKNFKKKLEQGLKV
jgi:5-(carboxyamino)imidazole ribonucleotide mutase